MTQDRGGPLDGAVELLERSLGYTRVMLADVRPDNLRRPTPCAGWSLSRLLEHMEDALDAFIEAAAGRVEVAPVPPTATRADALREKACALLGAWTAARPASVVVGDRDLDSSVLVATAALEITIHGWDVSQATGRGATIPHNLARGLLPVAHYVVHPADRGTRFAHELPVGQDSSYDTRLLAYLGRSPERDPGVDLTGPPRSTLGEPHPRPGLAS